MIPTRISRLRAQLDEEGFDAYLSFSSATNEYLSGFRGSTSCIIVTSTQNILLCDFRYTEQAGAQAPDFEVHQVEGTIETRAGEWLEKLSLENVAFDSTVMSVWQLGMVEAEFEGKTAPAPNLVRALRQVKDADEIARIRAASQLAEGVLQDMLPQLKEGVAEQEFAAQFQYEFRRRGAQRESFDMIALFGARSSLPHGVPGAKTLERGDVVLLDFGCILNSYCSDLTRTFCFGNIPGAWFQDIYDLTLRAQLAALNAVKPGARCVDVDALARTIIDDGGYGEYFGHGLGHGVGLEIHESPRLNKQATAVLEPGMVVTVEPGIYLPGKGGVRIEDLVVVTETGCDIVTRSSKELRILG